MALFADMPMHEALPVTGGTNIVIVIGFIHERFDGFQRLVFLGLLLRH